MRTGFRLPESKHSCTRFELRVQDRQTQSLESTADIADVVVDLLSEPR